jgi:hypothetical protein
MKLPTLASIFLTLGIVAAQTPGIDDRGQMNVKLSGAKGDGSTDDTARIQAALNNAARLKVGVYFPPGTYAISAPLEVSAPVEMAREATVKAVAPMSAVVNVGSAAPVANGSFTGGILDANDMAKDGLFLRQYEHFEIQHTAVLNAVANGFHFGDPTLKGGYEGIANMLRTERTKGQLHPGSTGLLIDNKATDNNIAQSVFVSSDLGVKALTGGNFFSDIHVWSKPSIGAMSTAFEDEGSGNFWRGCEADTTAVGLHATKYNTVVIGCRFYNNGQSGKDNQMVGVRFDQSAPYATMVGNLFIGADDRHKLAKDFDQNASSTVIGAQRAHVAQISPDTLKTMSSAPTKMMR